jgi:outer membrane protein OmpA-like peptidoglycan-associated protein
MGTLKGLARFALALAAACGSTSAAMPRERGGAVVHESIHCYFLQQATFAKGSAEVTDSAEIVSSLANAMTRDREAFVLIELSGHGSPDEDDVLELSTVRANAVRDRLIALGVEPSRVRVKGYGAHCSMRAPEDEEELARARDRRVETKILRTKDGDTGVELGCDAATAAGIR